VEAARRVYHLDGGAGRLAGFERIVPQKGGFAPVAAGAPARSEYLAAARAAKKSEVHAVERSQGFEQRVSRKLEQLCEDLGSCSTSCASESPHCA